MTDEETLRRLDREFQTFSEWRHSIDVERATDKARMDSIDKDLQRIAKAVEKTNETMEKNNDGQKWLTRVVIGGFAAYVLKFIVEGNLAGPGIAQ